MANLADISLVQNARTYLASPEDPGALATRWLIAHETPHPPYFRALPTPALRSDGTLAIGKAAKDALGLPPDGQVWALELPIAAPPGSGFHKS